MKKKFTPKTRSTDRGHILYGLNGCLELLRSHRFKPDSIHLLKDGRASRDSKISNFLKKIHGKVQVLPREVFQKKYEGMRTQGIVIRFRGDVIRKAPSFLNAAPNTCLLIVDNIEDPQNLGQIIRTCECAGVSGLVIPEHHSVGVVNSVMQVSQGAFVYLPIYNCGNLNGFLSQLKKDGFWITALENSIKARPWYEINYTEKVAIVVGSEGKGIRPLVLKNCDFKATIPMDGKIGSLNVSASVAAILFERQRQLLSRK